ncbi:MAG: hypothetical protein FJX00_03620 [Alphaproteobacteria bacterium]|nr:hypothetical protein [Alphaproteobacteria bacterium]
MRLFFIGIPLFLSLASGAYSEAISPTNLPCLIAECLMQNPSIIEHALMENPDIMARFFKTHPSVFSAAQQDMIEHFSETVSCDLKKNTQRLFKNSPELWGHLQKAPITSGKRHIIVFLDPLCPHSMALFRDLLALSSHAKTPLALCPHWITQHHDVNGQIIVRSLMAAHILGKLQAYLDIILNQTGPLSAGLALTLAKKIGCDIKAFHSHMFNAHTDQYLMDARAYGNQFQFPSFPTMLYQKDDLGDHAAPNKSFEMIEGRPDSLSSLAKMVLG